MPKLVALAVAQSTLIGEALHCVRRVNLPSSLNSPETNLLLVISIARAGWTNTGEPSHPQAILDVQV